jgi:hypothetical protein
VSESGARAERERSESASASERESASASASERESASASASERAILAREGPKPCDVFLSTFQKVVKLKR